MNINQLKYFITVAETRNFTRAAEQFFVSQTAITQQIHALEHSLDVTLFDRSRRPIELTPAGKAFLREAKSILERVSSAVAKTRAASTGIVGELRLGYTKGYERSRLSEILRAFHTAFPNVLITCFRDDTDELASGLRNDKFDIIFTWDSTNIAQEERVVTEVLEHYPLTVALFGDHPLVYKNELTRADLRNEAIIYMSPSRDGQSYGDRRYYDQYENAGYMPNIVQISNDVESVLMMVAAGEGISILPDYAVRKLGDAENLIFLPLIGDDEQVEIITAHNADNTNPALEKFLIWFDRYRSDLE